ncbi:MAG: N-acetyl-gamma-glutamyl-phosphate reductase [Candidatus Omnitrophota bacterium]
MINAGIVGATGYAGEELIDLLLRHPLVRITHISAKIDKPRKVSEIFPRFKNKIELTCQHPNPKDIVAVCDVVFLALPHTVSMEIAPFLLKHGKKVIDLSADYRLKDAKIYKKYYGLSHKDRQHIGEAVYGLPEIYRAKIKKARMIANPGCYPTASLLALAPLVTLGFVDFASIIIDAKSGVTGAGRKIAEGFLFSEINEDFKAYKVDCHQHAPEINQELSRWAGRKVNATFVPHLLPLDRGILSTVYVKKSQKSEVRNQKLIPLYKKFYKTEPFVRIREEGDFPRLQDVVKSNFCDIGIKESVSMVIIIAAIDNLMKGASGQAVQNMNIMYGFPEQTGLV